MSSQLGCADYLAYAVEIIARRLPPIRQMSFAPRQVVVRRLSSSSCFEPRQITDRRPERCADDSSWSRRKLRWKKSREIAANANDKLASALLGHAEGKCICYLRDDAVTEQAGLMLDTSEVFA